MSVLDNGLPASFFTRKRAALMGLAIGGIFLIANELYHKAAYYLTEPKAAPVCYGPVLAEGRKPVPADLRNSSGQSIDDRPVDQGIARVLSTMAICTPQSCPREAWKAYRGAMFWYVATRSQHMSHLYRNYGDVGLMRARAIYRKKEDTDIIEGLRARYAASIFRLNDFRQNKAAISIFILRGSEALRPCGKGDEANDG